MTHLRGPSVRRPYDLNRAGTRPHANKDVAQVSLLLIAPLCVANWEQPGNGGYPDTDAILGLARWSTPAARKGGRPFAVAEPFDVGVTAANGRDEDLRVDPGGHRVERVAESLPKRNRPDRPDPGGEDERVRRRAGLRRAGGRVARRLTHGRQAEVGASASGSLTRDVRLWDASLLDKFT